MRNNESLKGHKNKAHSTKTFYCDNCDYSTNTKDGLRLHIKYVHLKSQVFPCHLCDFKTSYPSHIKTHLGTHSNDRKFACKTCGKKFKTKIVLTEHESIHMLQKNEKCDFPGCNYATITQKRLKVHKKRHGADKKFPCDICDYKAIHRSALQLHLSTHSTERNFECLTCGKKFKNATMLRSHEYYHNTDKHFKCDQPQCDYATHVLQLLKNHKRTHIEESFKCGECDKIYKSESGLQYHRKTTHQAVESFYCENPGCEYVGKTLHLLKVHQRKHQE